jgi:hypothetical protein
VRRRFFHRGQNLVDLALLIGVLGLVLVGMSAYLKRSVQGKVKNLADHIISDQQSAEPPDTGGVESQTALSLGSTMQSEEFRGGGRRLTVNEYSTSDYNSSSAPDNSINKP